VAQRRADHPVVVDGEVTITYGELRERADAAAAAFIAAGVQPGDRVAIWAPNTWHWVVALLGAQSAGGVLVPLNTRYRGDEAAQILRAAGVSALCVNQGFLGFDFLGMLEGLDIGAVGTIVNWGEPVAADRAQSFDDFLAAGAAVGVDEVDRRVAALAPGDLSDMLFTSGTTGAPKGVMCTHGQTPRAFAEWARVVGLTADDRYLVVNPFFHSFGYKAGIVAAMTVGCTIYPEPVFDAAKVMDDIERLQITMVPGAPALFQTILNHPGLATAELGSLRLAVTGAAAIPTQLIVDMREVLGFDTVISGYGLTEASGIATMSRFDDDPDTIANFSGRAIDGVEVEIHDAAGNVVPPLTAGEVVVRGYNVMLGYFNDPEKTAEAIDADGWLHTGDIGIMDERGYLKITDRLKDMFINGGFNAYPAEIESLLGAHPDIGQVAVIGVPDERMGEVGAAFVVAAPGAQPDPAEITAWAKEHMANFKVPRHIRIVDSLPLNASGKVVKPTLRERFEHDNEDTTGDSR
jgi:acyl-CoA synthetase (AMP-forming)/AMP-acid ligase II